MSQARTRYGERLERGPATARRPVTFYPTARVYCPACEAMPGEPCRPLADDYWRPLKRGSSRALKHPHSARYGRADHLAELGRAGRHLELAANLERTPQAEQRGLAGLPLFNPQHPRRYEP